MGKQYKVAVIGAGDMGTNHVRGWQLAGHEVVSITDADAKRAGDLAGMAGIPKVFQRYEDAIREKDAEIVSICLPLAFHRDVTVFAAEHGKHVFCEKPLASSLNEVQRMKNAVEKAGVKFAVGFQRNFSHGVELAAEWVRQGKFGRPMVMSTDLLQEVRPKRVMHDKNGNQGPVVDTACHFFLMWETIFGSKPKSVYARGGILAKDRPEISHFKEVAVDTAVVTIEYESGDIGTLTICWGLAANTKIGSRPDRIIGPLGAAEGHFNTWGKDASWEAELYSGDGRETVSLERRELFQMEFEHFAAAIENGGPVRYGFDHGERMQRLSYAVLDSIEKGTVVYL